MTKFFSFSIIFLITTFSLAAAPTSFLPMEDGLSSGRHPVYGASIEKVKPYRQAIPMEEASSVGFEWGKADLALCALLIGIYFMFVRKKSNTRSISL